MAGDDFVVAFDDPLDDPPLEDVELAFESDPVADSVALEEAPEPLSAAPLTVLLPSVLLPSVLLPSVLLPSVFLPSVFLVSAPAELESPEAQREPSKDSEEDFEGLLCFELPYSVE